MSLLVSPNALEARRAEVARSADLAALAANLRGQVREVLTHPLYVPEAKALLSRWGAHCRDDGAELGFDPWNPHAHRCTLCGRVWNTEQSHRWWVYWYQLWLAERVWLLALHGGPGGDAAAEERACEALALLVERYQGYPPYDNVLGPSRPFFSTYLESVWVLHLVVAAQLLDDLGRLPRDLAADLRARLFAPSAALIADFDEGRSNRQVWNAAALFALGRRLGDGAMARAAAQGASGVVALAGRGLLGDGLWYEGENYHWFALRGLAWGAALLREAGEVDLWAADGDAAARFRAAFRAPVLTALPDFTFPARRDARFGVSLRQRRMAELWEVASAEARRHSGTEEGGFYASLLAHVYDPAVPAREASAGEITDVERHEPAAGVRRDRLGWKGLLWAAPELERGDASSWRPGTVHLGDTGLAVFRRDAGTTYVSVDYGESGGAHGHPDRLNLTLVHRGTPWLLDFGTGSYVSPSLGWYRMTLAHNAPLLDGQSQAPARGTCVAFDERGDWGWACALLDGSAYPAATLQRTVVVGPDYVLDVMQMGADVPHQLLLPWHGLGRPVIEPLGVTFTGEARTLRVLMAGRQPFQVLLQRAPGPARADAPAEELEFPVVAAQGDAVTLAACLDLGAGVEELECVAETYVVRLPGGRVHVHRPTDDGWMVELDRGDPVELGGVVAGGGEPGARSGEQGAEGHELAGIAGQALGQGGWSGAALRSPLPAARLVVPRLETAPLLDGSLAGFPPGPALRLDTAEQFRRAEEPWGGPEDFSARAWLVHDGGQLYVAVEVTTRAPVFRPSDAADPEWENESPDIHSDGVQLYLEATGFYGWLIVPVAEDPSRLRVTAVRGTDAATEMVTAGAWAPMEHGYRLSFAVDVPDLLEGEFGLDLAVNRMHPGRERRSGQLIWSGARGQRLYLAGDRPADDVLPRVTAA